MTNVQVDLSLFQARKINEIMCGDRRVSIRMIAEIVNADKGTAREILHDELNMKKASAKLVPKNLTPDQKLVHQQICSDFLVRLVEEPELMEYIIIAMKLEYSTTMLKLSSNPCTGKLLHHQE
jgi:hypothetical protein